MYEMELYHHGIKGQKWGVRRYQNKDGSYKSGAEGRYDGDRIIKKVSGSIKGGLAARKKSKDLSSANKKLSAENKKLSAKNQKLEAKNQKLADKNKKEFHLSDRQKKALKIGAAVAGTALAAYGAKKLYDHIDVSTKGKAIAKKLLNDAGGDFEKASEAWVERRTELNKLKGSGQLGKYGVKQDKILAATQKSISDQYRKSVNSSTLLSKDLQAAKEAASAHRKEQFSKATKGLREASSKFGSKAKDGANVAKSKANEAAVKVRSKSKEVAKNARAAYERNAGKRMANAINRDYARRQAMSKARDTVKSASSRARTAAGKAVTAAKSGASKAQEYVYNKSMERTRNSYAKRVARDLRRRGRL